MNYVRILALLLLLSVIDPLSVSASAELETKHDSGPGALALCFVAVSLAWFKLRGPRRTPPKIYPAVALEKRPGPTAPANRPDRGMTLVEIMIVVAIIGMLAAIGIPATIRAREKSVSTACQNNLRQISSACDQYRLEHAGKNPAALAELCGSESYIKVLPVCPGSGTYTITENEPSCSRGGTHSLEAAQ
jgi:prepilin-type N-terminal cleavage/methylation domain-containing protein